MKRFLHWLRQSFHARPAARRPRYTRLTLEGLEDRLVMSTTYWVTNTNDAGAGSLRQAISDVDYSHALHGSNFADPDRIAFQIGSGGVRTIALRSVLPDLTGAVIVDGTTQLGYAGQPLIELNGAGVGGGPYANGLHATGGDTIRGLVINRFAGSGIFLDGPGSSVLQGNYIGTDVTGTRITDAAGLWLGNGEGVTVGGYTLNCVIGGTTAAARNVISGNKDAGIVIAKGATGNKVQGNYIGTDRTGTAGLGNSNSGVTVFGDSNQIGGTSGAGNVIAGSVNGATLKGYGVCIDGGSHNQVQGNYLGTDATGTKALENLYGVFLTNQASANLIGGATSDTRNVISGNAYGVYLTNGAWGNQVQRNYIGTDRSGNVALPNWRDGVWSNAGSNQIGGAYGAGNVIAGNGGNGVRLAYGASSNTVQGNYIGTNATGSLAVPNYYDGVFLDSSAAYNTVGGTFQLDGSGRLAGTGNLISGNQGNGVSLYGGANHNQVLGNRIGTDPTGTLRLGNQQNGVWIGGYDSAQPTSSNLIGDKWAGAGNTIAFNRLAGVSIQGAYAYGNPVRGNALYGNGGKAIDVQTLRVIAPVLQYAVSGSSTTVFGNVMSFYSFPTVVTVDLYASSPTDGVGQARRYLGSIPVFIPTAGAFPFGVALPAATTKGEVITATVTDPWGNTSMLSNGLAAV